MNAIPPHDDDALWQEAMEGVRMLGSKEKITSNAADPHIIVVPQEKGNAPLPHVKALSYLSADDNSYVDGKLASNLRQGKLAIEGRLDMHGMTQDEALPALQAFLDSSYTAGKRCVVVVTGKGQRREEGRGVLKQRLPDWLNLPSLRPYLLMFCEALPRDGGSGAYYVLLRKRR